MDYIFTQLQFQKNWGWGQRVVSTGSTFLARIFIELPQILLEYVLNIRDLFDFIRDELERFTRLPSVFPSLLLL